MLTVSWWFPVFLWVEIGRQHGKAPLAASPIDDSPTHPTKIIKVHSRIVTMGQRGPTVLSPSKWTFLVLEDLKV